VPDGIQSILLSLNGSADIADIRNKAKIAQKQAGQFQGLDRNSYILRGADMTLQGPGRQLTTGGTSPTGLQGKGGPQ
jgi:hypothetical protein